MLIDKELVFSDAQAVTASAASTKNINQGAAGDAYDTLFLVIQVREAAAAAGAATVNFQVQTDSDPAFGTAVTVLDSGSIGKAALGINTELKFRLPYGLKQYIRVYYSVGTGPLTAGKFDAFLTDNVNLY